MNPRNWHQVFLGQAHGHSRLSTALGLGQMLNYRCTFTSAPWFSEASQSRLSLGVCQHCRPWLLSPDLFAPLPPHSPSPYLYPTPIPTLPLQPAKW